jgi:anti-sigma regulatory factor (Ser/Thr protein kinase)
VEQLQHAAGDLALVDQTDGVRLAKAVAEALRNAIYHGNLELSEDQIEAAAEPSAAGVDALALRREQHPYCDRRVHLRAAFTPREARFTIQDEGPGFDPARLPDVRADPSYLARDGGRGLVLIDMFMDEVRFSPTGNEITLVKHASPTAKGEEP